jgi:DNA-directed RNA polymerase subunit M/transcription elongation factor TFIIS
MADINYTLNLLFHETGVFIFQKYFGTYWYENELLPSICEDVQRNPSAPTILKDYLLGKKNKTDLDVSILSRYLLYTEKYKNLITKNANYRLNQLRKDRNIIGHDVLSITQDQKRIIVRDIINTYNDFNDIIFSESLVKNINDLAGLYGFETVLIRKDYSSNANSSSGNNNKNNQTTYSQNNTEKHWWEKDTDQPRNNNQQWYNSSKTTFSTASNNENNVNNKNYLNEAQDVPSQELSKELFVLCFLVLIAYIITIVLYGNRPKILLASTVIFGLLITLLKIINSIIKRKRNRNKIKDMSKYKGKTISITCPKCGKIIDAPDTNGDVKLKCFSCKYEFLFSSVDIKNNKAVKKNKKRKEHVINEKHSESQREKVIYICPFCKRKIRVDKPRKPIIVTCPICKNEFTENP